MLNDPHDFRHFSLLFIVAPSFSTTKFPFFYVHGTMPEKLEAANNSYQEDWDKSLASEGDSPSQTSENASQQQSHNASTPRNSVIFPAVERDSDVTPSRNVVERGRYASGQGGRTLSDLLRLHAEKGTDCRLSPEEATRLGDVLGQWVSHCPLLLILATDFVVLD